MNKGQIDKLKKQFSQIDKNKDGFIQFDEMLKQYEIIKDKSMSEADFQKLVRDIFDKLDDNKDGNISFDEFCNHAKK